MVRWWLSCKHMFQTCSNVAFPSTPGSPGKQTWYTCTCRIRLFVTNQPGTRKKSHLKWRPFFQMTIQEFKPILFRVSVLELVYPQNSQGLLRRGRNLFVRKHTVEHPIRMGQRVWHRTERQAAFSGVNKPYFPTASSGPPHS